MLVVPVDENSTGKAAHFNDLLARAYVFGEHGSIRDLLRVDIDGVKSTMFVSA